MTPRYLELFRSHWILFLLPVVLAGAVALWVGLAAPTLYRSSTTLWADAPRATSNAQQPSAREQATLSELLATRQFRRLVADRSGLRDYVESHPDDWGATAPLGKLRSTKSVEGRIAAALSSKHVRSIVKGPHVLEVRYDAPAPKLAMVTLDAIVKQLITQRAALRDDALGAAGKQLAAASNALTSARNKLTRYLAANRRSTRKDPRLTALAAAERRAATKLADTAEAMRTELTPLLASETSLHIVDTPQLPSGPIGGTKRLVVTLFAGLFAGAVISGLGIVAIAMTSAGGAPGERRRAPAWLVQPTPSPARPSETSPRRTVPVRGDREQRR